MSVNIKIAKAYITLIAASIIGHILSMGKEILVANYFGISIKMDAFYTAITVPNLVTSIIIGAFGLIFLPIFVQYRTANKEEANHLASIAVNYIFIFLFFASIIIFTFSKQIITYGFSGLNTETALLAIKILRILSITIIFTGLVGVITWILNGYEHFSAPSFSQMFITISIIAFILLFVKQMGIYVFAWGMLTGLIIQFIFLLPFTKRKGYNHYFDFNIGHPAIKKTLNLSLILILLGIISGIIPVINRIMASWLPSGSIAAMGYADKLVQVPLIIFSGSIATAIYPFFAGQLAENKIEEMKDTLAISIKMTRFVFIPLAVIMMILAKPTIQLLFQRGAFDEHATNLTSIIFICYAFQLFSSYAMVIMYRLLFVFQDIVSIFKITIASVPLTVIFNFIFIKTVNPPAAGIALSSSVVCLFITVLLFIFLKKRIKNLHGLSIIKSLLKTTLLAVISGIVIFFMHQFLNKFVLNQSVVVNKIFLIICSAISGVIVFIVMASVLKIEETEKIYSLIKNKVQNILKYGIINKI